MVAAIGGVIRHIDSVRCTLSAKRPTDAQLWLDSFHLETMEYSVSAQLKAEKEAFVTGHSGTTMLEVATVVAVGPVCSAQRW